MEGSGWDGGLKGREIGLELFWEVLGFVLADIRFGQGRIFIFFDYSFAPPPNQYKREGGVSV